jgi:leader peptidase (prepilin peptidase) / N-methyltransferase
MKQLSQAKARFVDQILNQIRRPFERSPASLPGYAAWGAAAVCAAIASVLAAPGILGLLGSALAIVMIAIAAIDAQRFVIPDKLVLAALIGGLVDASFPQPYQVAAGAVNAALRGFTLAFLFLIARYLYRRVRGRDGIGLGDVKLAAAAGVWLDWVGIAVAIDLAALSALAAVLIQVLRGQHVTRTSMIPFGLFFAPAIWVAWLYEATTYVRYAEMAFGVIAEQNPGVF